MVNLLPQLITNGLIAGAIYALVASGFSLLYSTNRFVHFAHGGVMTVAAYVFYSALHFYHASLSVAVLLSLLMAALVGWLCFALVYLPLQKRKASNTVIMLSSIGLLILIENILMLIFGAESRVIDYFPVSTGLSFLGIHITPLQLTILFVTLLLIGILFWFIQKTRHGITMRAIANNAELSSVIGISVRKFQHLSFIIGSLLGGIAGILIALERNIEAIMGTGLMIKGFTGAVVGGIHSIAGSIIGSFIVGLAENLGVAFISSGYKDAIAFIVLFVFLIFRPQGLFGVHKGTREE
jgi:branched-subunit amino acid ABC-type transport system permease component